MHKINKLLKKRSRSNVNCSIGRTRKHATSTMMPKEKEDSPLPTCTRDYAYLWPKGPSGPANRATLRATSNRYTRAKRADAWITGFRDVRLSKRLNYQDLCSLSLSLFPLLDPSSITEKVCDVAECPHFIWVTIDTGNFF